MNTWVGSKFEAFKSSWGQPQGSRPLEGGGMEYFYSLRLGNPYRCETYWRVNDAGIIESWSHEGRGCKMNPF